MNIGETGNDRQATGQAGSNDSNGPAAGSVTTGAVVDGVGETRKSRKERALAALLIHPNIKAAAKAVHLNERTIRRWLRSDPKFLARFRAGRREVLDVVVGELRVNAKMAVRILRGIARGKDDPAYARVAAARAVIDYTFKGTELVDVVERLEEAEEKLENAEKPRG